MLILNYQCTRSFWPVIQTVSIPLLAYLLSIIQTRFISISKALHWLGKYSLELYIIHLLIYYFLNLVDANHAEGVHILTGVAIALIICAPIHLIIDKMINSCVPKGTKGQ